MSATTAGTENTKSPTLYIWIPDWHTRQHYLTTHATENPLWIKAYTGRIRTDAYLALTLAERGLLHDIEMLVAGWGNGRLPASESQLRGLLSVRRVALEPLIHAGFIEVLSIPEQIRTEQIREEQSTAVVEPPYGGSTLNNAVVNAVGKSVVELALDDGGQPTTKTGREENDQAAFADAPAVAVGADAPTAVPPDDQIGRWRPSEPIEFSTLIAVLERLQGEECRQPMRRRALEAWQADPSLFEEAVEHNRAECEAGKMPRPIGALWRGALRTYLRPGGDGRQWDVDGEPAS